MAYTTAEARQQLLDDLAHAVDEIGVALAALGGAYELLDEHTADRLAALNGTLDIESSPGEGTQLRARLPCTER